MLWPGLVRSVPAVSPRSVAGSCGVLDVHRLFVLTFLSDLPFAVTLARLFGPVVHGLDHIGVFFTLLVLIFSGVAHSSAPVQIASVFFVGMRERDVMMR